MNHPRVWSEGGGSEDDDAERGETDNCLLQRKRERERDVLALGRSLTRVHPSTHSFETNVAELIELHTIVLLVILYVA